MSSSAGQGADESADRDSDHVDTDTETELYSQIYHEKNGDAHTGVDLLNHATPIESVDSMSSSQPAACPGPSRSPLKSCFDVVTISSDSDSDSEPSKSQLIGLKRKRSPSPDCLTSPDDDSDSDVVLLSDFDDSALHVPSVSNSVSTSYWWEPVAATKPSTSKSYALNGFLTRCRPNFVPGGHLQTVETPQKVSVDLLNSLPGSNNRFKRIRRSHGEDASLWRTDLVDPAAKSKSRYYNGKKLVACLNCKKFTDHVVSRCPMPRPPPTCFVCGQIGHLGKSCRKVICGRCFKTGHITTSCGMPVDKVTCTECNYPGHSFNDCPNHWRKYCTTTTTSDVEPKPEVVRNRRTACSICCSTSHFAFECPIPMSDKFPRCSPFLKKTSTASPYDYMRDIRRGSAPHRSCTISSSQASSSNSSFPNLSIPSFIPPPVLTDYSPNPFEGFRSGPTPLPRKSYSGAAAASGSSNRILDSRTATTAELQAAYPVSIKPAKAKKTKKQKQLLKLAQKAQKAVRSAKKRAKALQKSLKREAQADHAQTQDIPKTRNKGRKKENVYKCPDGQSRTWKEIWSAPTSSASSGCTAGPSHISTPGPQMGPLSPFRVKQELKRDPF